MDPLSIAVSAVSIAGAAAKISFFLYEVIESTARVDATVLALSKEVKALEKSLTALDTTLQSCRSQALVLMHMNDDVWHSIESNLLDCRETLEELTTLVEEVKRPGASYSTRNIFRKTNTLARLTLRKREITEFQDKIAKSNASMQTAVGVVSLSLALRQNVSQEMLMRELQRLRGLVENTQRVARNSSSTYPAAARMSRNIEGLVKAATKFHSSASSTASTMYGGPQAQRRRQPVARSTWGLGSDAGSLTDYDRDRIQNWTTGLRVIDEVTDTASTVDTAPSHSGTYLTADRETVVTTPDLEDEDDDDLELDLEIFQNAEHLGRVSFGKSDYDNAEKFLNKALSGATGTSSDAAHFENLKLQLSICYCFQAKWEAAEAVLSTLGKKKRKVDLPVFHLLHAVALAHLADEKYDAAYGACKRSLQGKKKAHGGRTNQDYIDGLALLAAICEVRGEPIEAASIRHSIPKNLIPDGFPDPEEFIRSHGSIIDDAFGQGFLAGARVAEEEEQAAHDEVDEEEDYERLEQDTGKEVGTGDPEHEASYPSRVSGWDTGKEFLNVQQGGHMTFNPVTQKRIYSTVETFDQKTGKILAWADWDNCRWIELLRYWDWHGESMIFELIIDEGIRQYLGLAPLRSKPDEEKWSDIMVVHIEQQHEMSTRAADSHGENAYFGKTFNGQPLAYEKPPPLPNRPPPLPHRVSTAFNTQYTPYPNQSTIPDTPNMYYPSSEKVSQNYYDEQASRDRFPGATWPPLSQIPINVVDEFKENLYISEPRGDGVTSAPSLHSAQNSNFLSPMTPPPRPQHHPSRSMDMIPRQFESNNPFRRAASLRSLNNLAMTGSSGQSQTMRHMASFETATYQYVPPSPWTARRYGNSRESPRVLQTPAVFLRDVPDGKTDGIILGVNLSLETIEVTVCFEDGTSTKCPGTLYLNEAGKNHTGLPWFDCLEGLTNSPSSPPLNSSTTQPSSSSSTGPFTMTAHPYNLLQMLQLHAIQSHTTLDTFITNTLLPLPSPSTYAHSATSLESALTRLQAGLARWIDTTKGNLHLTFTPLDEVVFSVPDALLSMPSAKTKILDLLSKNDLFRHVKITAASVAVVWFFLGHHSTSILGHQSSRRSVQVLVIQTGHLLTEFARYTIVSENGAVIVRPSGETRSELLGCLAVEMNFARMAHDKIVSILARFKMRLGHGKLMGLVRACTSQFRARGLVQFDVDGGEAGDGEFVVEGLDVPAGFPGLENGRLVFGCHELIGCYGKVVQGVVDVVGEACQQGSGVSHVFVAGTFASSVLLRNSLTDLTDQNGGPTLWHEADCASYGAVLQAKQLDFVNLQTS